MSAAHRTEDFGVHRFGVTWGVCAAALLLGACSGEPSPPAVTVTDSAGVRITLSGDVASVYAALSADPVVSLGGPNAEGPTQFYQITNVQLDERRRVWVSDWQSGELRVFGADGAHEMTLGGRGDGPGEFLGIRLLGMFGGDSVAVADQQAARLTVYTAEGRLARTDRLETGDEPVPRPFDTYPDGSVFGQVPTVFQAAGVEPGTLLTGEVRLMRFDGTGAPRAVALAEAGPSFIWTGDAMVPIPFTANAAFDLDGEVLHLAVGTDFRVRVFEGGRLVRVYGVDREPEPVRPADVDAYYEMVAESYPEERQAALRSAMDHPARPTVLPGYVGLVVADDGTVWAGRYAPDTTWDVFDVAGRLLGQVETPPDFHPMSVHGDRVAGVWLDALGVEYVRVYGIERRSR